MCALVDDSDMVNAKAATEYVKKLREGAFRDYSVGLLHGKMKSFEKEEIMRAFAKGEVDVLVATTVIEVGVDVPNATVMVIENAERFGLSQLHQLRGRVGRGGEQSYCIIFGNTGSGVAEERMKVMCETNDGFKIAEKDLGNQGPGRVFRHQTARPARNEDRQLFHRYGYLKGNPGGGGRAAGKGPVFDSPRA